MSQSSRRQVRLAVTMSTLTIVRFIDDDPDAPRTTANAIQRELRAGLLGDVLAQQGLFNVRVVSVEELSEAQDSAPSPESFIERITRQS